MSEQANTWVIDDLDGLTITIVAITIGTWDVMVGGGTDPLIITATTNGRQRVANALSGAPASAEEDTVELTVGGARDRARIPAWGIRQVDALRPQPQVRIRLEFRARSHARSCQARQPNRHVPRVPEPRSRRTGRCRQARFYVEYTAGSTRLRSGRASLNKYLARGRHVHPRFI